METNNERKVLRPGGEVYGILLADIFKKVPDKEWEKMIKLAIQKLSEPDGNEKAAAMFRDMKTSYIIQNLKGLNR
jgi:hypothetical protein